ncbi:MAG TPA: twin-arginine translocase TatA/TatE family subunit [Acidimicrobiales bacterium]|nr:twin-arginine translocase TatA/TatE family subunit [Acidimicrobiales bacterium]
MFSLDPAKLLLIAVVAIVVLGPDKLPAAARKISSLMKDLQKMRGSLETEAKKFTGDLPFGDELRSARETIGKVTAVPDPRQALYRAAGLSSSGGTEHEQSGQGSDAGIVPGSIDVSFRESTGSGTTPSHDTPFVGAGSFATVSAGSSPNAASVDRNPSQH